MKYTYKNDRKIQQNTVVMLIKCSKNERVKKLQSLSPDVIAAVALGVSLNLKMNDTIDSVRIND